MAEVRTVRSRDEADRALDLAEAVWGVRPISDPMLRALEFAGMYLSVATEGDDVVGMCAGFVGVLDGDDDPELHLHSHLAAVAPGRRGTGIGRALKRHQRDWCLERSIGEVSWTFDPLVGANARFNLHHLGALGAEYHPNLYGAMDDDVNRGDESDRLLVRWDLRCPATVRALSGAIPLAATGRADEYAVIVDNGEPQARDTATPRRYVHVPDDIGSLRAHDPALAGRWRVAVRGAMVSAFADGLHLVAVATDGSYVLGRDDPR